MKQIRLQKLLLKAIQYAIKMHEGQKRKVSEEPYVSHPLHVAYLLLSYKTNSKNGMLLAIAAILHDTVEDTKATIEDIRKLFGEMVAEIVQELSNDEELLRKIGKPKLLKKKLLEVTKYTLTIKMVDRLSNIEDGPTEKYLNDTLELLDFLKKNRALTRTQLHIMADIEKECKYKLNKGV